MQAGFITPPALHYVRNHGAVPVKTEVPADRQRVWDDWTITVDGLVDKPLTLTMNDLMRLPQVLPYSRAPIQASSHSTISQAFVRPHRPARNTN